MSLIIALFNLEFFLDLRTCLGFGGPTRSLLSSLISFILFNRGNVSFISCYGNTHIAAIRTK